MPIICYYEDMTRRWKTFLYGALRDIFPPILRRDPAYWRRLVLGFVVIVLIVTQLFTFEKFPGVVGTWQLPGGMVAVAIVAGLLPFLEVLSLPFLLSMQLSRVVRRVSQGSLVCVSATWCGVSLWCTLTQPLSESGLFGATLPLMNGWWTVSFSILLLVAVFVVVQPRRERLS